VTSVKTRIPNRTPGFQARRPEAGHLWHDFIVVARLEVHRDDLAGAAIPGRTN